MFLSRQTLWRADEEDCPEAQEMEIPPNIAREAPRMGKETLKQHIAAAGLLQQMQHNLYHGDLIAPSITQGKMVKYKLMGYKKSENARRMARFEDAAARKYSHCLLNYQLSWRMMHPSNFTCICGAVHTTSCSSQFALTRHTCLIERKCAQRECVPVFLKKY